jgi:hypothetical protein
MNHIVTRSAKPRGRALCLARGAEIIGAFSGPGELIDADYSEYTSTNPTPVVLFRPRTMAV